MIRRSLQMLLWMTLVTGVIYPLLVTVVAQLAMPEQANGSFIKLHGKVVGSRAIGQKFVSAKYFWGRPSAHDYDPLNSGGSNLGPISLELKNLVSQRRSSLVKANNIDDSGFVPNELLFASGSGLDPHISVEAALFQKSRILKARGWTNADNKRLEEMIMGMVTKRKFGFIGEPYLNVLELNLALDELQVKL